MTRPYIDKTNPEIYRALNGAVRAARTSYAAVGLPLDLVELVNVRVSQINGCPTCLSVHVPAARAAGVDQQTLDLLPSWRQDTSQLFTAPQRAALELAEALTEPQPGTGLTSVADAVAAASREFDDDQLSALEWAVVLINAYNRVSIASGHPPAPRDRN
ncbi:carboxymuconolactone decarboxylase family protein [Corynebacterium kalidii]|uniref:Carboxymuconolactone decarboxylase family protein n=1 Tax=Corynebacterium kalidii TaxID=2931982 RepID=A0A9X2AYC1_9CORY|nr:carboxymuconolactone decarboxylase family protein [Corynebacterium kalidii]MCJ7857428.1 carboxymuconolactone decarboxylase family protein [Corynebacterium kalidii]